MNSFEVIFIPPTHTDASIYVPTFSRIYNTLEKLCPFLSITGSFLLTVMKDSLLGSGEMYISPDQFLSFPEEQSPRETLKTNDGGSRAYLYFIAPIRV